MVLGILFLILVGVLAMVFPKSKWVTFIAMLYIFVLYGFNSYSGDSAIYELVYENVGRGQMLTEFEPGFIVIMMFSNFLHLPFVGFRVILVLIYIILLYIAVRKYTNCTALVMFIFILFPFPYFLSVLRAGIAGIVIVIGLNQLVTLKKYWVIRYLIFIAIATLFHYSSLIFIPLIFAAGRKRKSAYFFIGTVFLAVAIYMLFNTGALASFVGLFTDRGKILNWVSFDNIEDRSNIKGIIGSLLIVCLNIFFTFDASRIYDKNARLLSRSLDSYPARLANTVKYINITMILIIPFLLVTSVYLRFIWEILLINICVMVNAADVASEKSIRLGLSLHRNITFNALPTIIYSILLFLYTNLPYMGTKADALKMFENNYILNFLGM